MDGRRIPDARVRLDGLYVAGVMGGLPGRGTKVCGNSQRDDEYGRSGGFLRFVSGVRIYGHILRRLQRAAVSDGGAVAGQRLTLLTNRYKRAVDASDSEAARACRRLIRCLN